MSDGNEQVEHRVRDAIRIGGPDSCVEDRILARALEREPSRAWRSRPFRRSSSLVAVAIVLLGLGVYLWPRQAPEVDVVARAMASMERPDTVIHLTMETWSWVTPDPPTEEPQPEPWYVTRTEAWVDGAHDRIRMAESGVVTGENPDAWFPQEPDPHDSDPREVMHHLLRDGLVRTLYEGLWVHPYTDETLARPVYHERDIEEVPLHVSLVYSYAEALRDGTVAVVEDEDVASDLVRIRFIHERPDGGGSGVEREMTVTADLRRSDLLPVRLRIERRGVDLVDGSTTPRPFVDTMEAVIEPRVMALSDVPAGTFELEAPPDAVVRIDRRLQQGETDELIPFDVYWLGESFGEREWQGYVQYQVQPRPPFPALREWRRWSVVTPPGDRFGERKAEVVYHPGPGVPEWQALFVLSFQAEDVRSRRTENGWSMSEESAALAELLDGVRDQVVHEMSFVGSDYVYVARLHGDTVVFVMAHDESLALEAADMVRKVAE